MTWAEPESKRRWTVVTPSAAMRLEHSIIEADRSASDLHALFDELTDQFGRHEASHLWWAAFGAIDAAET